MKLELLMMNTDGGLAMIKQEDTIFIQNRESLFFHGSKRLDILLSLKWHLPIIFAADVFFHHFMILVKLSSSDDLKKQTNKQTEDIIDLCKYRIRIKILRDK